MLIFGRDCGCDDRREYIANNRLPFLILAGLVIGLTILLRMKL